MKMSNKPLFSVVIPTLNEEKFLPLLLKDLQRQTFIRFEVLVIDGNSEDKTLEKVRELQNKLVIRSISTEKRNVSFQRNLGAQEAQAKWVIFMDADNRIPIYFLEGIKYQLAKHKSTDVFSTFVSIKEKSTMNKTIEQVINIWLVGMTWLEKPSAVGALIGCKKSIFQKIQFSEEQKFLEDGLFVKTIHEAGYKFMLFREPRFFYSLRRMKKEGNLKNWRTIASLQLKYLSGNNLSDIQNYPMVGGSYYDDIQANKESHWRFTLQNFFKAASKRQLQQARTMLASLRELEF